MNQKQRNYKRKRQHTKNLKEKENNFIKLRMLKQDEDVGNISENESEDEILLQCFGYFISELNKMSKNGDSEEENNKEQRNQRYLKKRSDQSLDDNYIETSKSSKRIMRKKYETRKTRRSKFKDKLKIKESNPLDIIDEEKKRETSEEKGSVISFKSQTILREENQQKKKQDSRIDKNKKIKSRSDSKKIQTLNNEIPGRIYLER